MFSRLTRLPRHRQFDYKPRYWNPEKEDLERRVAQALREYESEHGKATPEQVDQATRAERIRSGFQRPSVVSKKHSQPTSPAKLRLLILAVLAGFAALFYHYGGLLF